jgi:small conductance mechanosensitive channel
MFAVRGVTGEKVEEQVREQVDMAAHVHELVVNFLVSYSFQLLGAIVVLVAGMLITRWVAQLLMRAQERRDVDVTLRQFIASTVRMLIVGLFLIVALSQLGISITPLIAAIGGLAIGASFALQGPIGNYGAGLAIILTRAYADDPVAAIAVIRTAISGVEGVAADPPPQVGIAGFEDSSVGVDYRFRVPTDRYYELLYQTNPAVYQALGRHGVTIPFPQHEVRLERG